MYIGDVQCTIKTLEVGIEVTLQNTKSRNTNESLLELNLVDSSDRSKEEYLDRYERVKSEIVDTTRFDENSDLSTTYLGKINMT